MHVTFSRRLAALAATALLTVLLFPANGSAQLLNLPIDPTFPTIQFDPMPKHDPVTFEPIPGTWIGTTRYNAVDRTLEIDLYPQKIVVPAVPGWNPPGMENFLAGTANFFWASEELQHAECYWCGRFTVRIKVDALGNLLASDPGSVDLKAAAHVALYNRWHPSIGPLQWNYNGTLLQGNAVSFGFQDGVNGAPDRLEFRFALPNGLFIANDPFVPNVYMPGLHDLAVVVLTDGFPGNFANSFQGSATGFAGATTSVGGGQPLCNAQIGGAVFNDLNKNGVRDAGEAGLPNFPVMVSQGITLPDGNVQWNPIQNQQNPKNTDAAGGYSFQNLCGGMHRVDVSPVGGYVPSATNSVQLTLTATSTASANVGFFLPPPPPTRPYLTFWQGGWGSKPAPGNAGKLLADNFSAVYGTAGVTIGANTRTLKFLTAASIEKFLPVGGWPAPLPKITVLAGEVLALKLNVDFSYAGVTRPGLGSLRLTRGSLKGWSVAQVLDLSNSALGGGTLPTGLQMWELALVIAQININFEGGLRGLDLGYLAEP